MGLHYMVFVLLAVLTSIFIYRKVPAPDNKFMILLFTGSMATRCIIALALAVISYLHHRTLFVSGDDLLYSDAASVILKQALDGTYTYKLLYFGANLYTHVLALFYGLFGVKIIASKFINCYLGSVIPVAAYFMSLRFSPNRAQAKVVAVIAALYPSFIFWSTHNIKEPLIILSVLLGIYVLLRAVSGKMTVSDLLLFIIFSILILNLQVLYAYQIAVIAAVILFSYLSRPFKIVFFLLIAASFIFIASRGDLLLKFSIIVEMHARNMAITDNAGYYVYPDSFIADMQSGRICHMAFVPIYLKGMAYFLFSPFPWRIGSLLQSFVLPQVVFWYLLLALASAGFVISLSRNRRRDTAVFAFVFVGMSLWALTEGNVGAAFRHRDHFAVIIFIYAIMGGFSLWQKRRL